MNSSNLNVADKRVLNLGCGQRKLDHAVNVDITSNTDPDLVHDLDKSPWPLPDNHFTEVVMNDVLEHLNDLVAAMEEIHRVCSPGALVRITVRRSLNKIIWRIANAYPKRYERRWAWIFPAWFLDFEPRALK